MAEGAQGIVDAHVHVYPAEVAAAPAAWAKEHGEPSWSACVVPPGKRSLQGWADPDALIAAMDQAGIETCVMLGWYWERQETCELQNEWYVSWLRRHPRRLRAFATVQPAAGDRALAALERALDRGLCGVGELLPQAQGYSLQDPVWLKVVALAARRGIPITLHATDPQAGPAAGPPTPLDAYVQLAKDFPQATFILAHWGGGLAFRAFSAAQVLPPNLFFDTAASPLLYDAAVFRAAVEKVGACQIIYGSDFPLILYPKGVRVAAFEPFLDEIASAGLTASERDQIMGSNIRRLLAPAVAPVPKRV